MRVWRGSHLKSQQQKEGQMFAFKLWPFIVKISIKNFIKTEKALILLRVLFIQSPERQQRQNLHIPDRTSCRLSSYQCWPLHGVNQCCLLPNTSLVYSALSSFQGVCPTKRNKTHLLTTCRGWCRVARESWAHPWLLSPRGWWGYTEQALSAKVHKCLGICWDTSWHQSETNRMNISCGNLPVQQVYLCSLTSFSASPDSHSFNFLSSWLSDVLQGARRLIWIPDVPQLVSKICGKEWEMQRNVRCTRA